MPVLVIGMQHHTVLRATSLVLIHSLATQCLVALRTPTRAEDTLTNFVGNKQGSDQIVRATGPSQRSRLTFIWMGSVKGVVFDLDGTLLDTGTDILLFQHLV